MSLDIIKFFKSFGLNVTDSTDPLLLLLCVIVLLSTIALFCVLNIIVYYGILYIFENNQILVSLTKRLPALSLRILNFYKNIRLVYILYDLLILLVCLISIIWLGGRVIYALLWIS